MTIDIIISLVVAVALLISLALYAASGKVRKDQHFDEMQLKLRADGYKLGFIVTIIILAIFILITEVFELRAISAGFGMFVALMAGVASFTCYCISKEAFFSIGEEGNWYITLISIITVSHGVLAASRIADGTLWENGIITFLHGSSLVLLLSFLSILFALVIKIIKNKREASE